MIYVRDAILTVTIVALIFLAAYQPTPPPIVKDNQEPYCVISYLAAGKDVFGNRVTGWAKGYGPCRLQDVYREI